MHETEKSVFRIAIPCDDCPNRKSNPMSDIKAARLSSSGNLEYRSTTTGEVELAAAPIVGRIKEAVKYCRQYDEGKENRRSGDCAALLRFFDDKSPRQVTQQIEGNIYGN